MDATALWNRLNEILGNLSWEDVPEALEIIDDLSEWLDTDGAMPIPLDLCMNRETLTLMLYSTHSYFYDNYNQGT